MKQLVLDDTIPYCVLHGWEGWPGKMEGDLDMAVAPQHLATLERSLHVQPAGRPVQLLQHETSGFYFVLAFETAQKLDFVPVDAATDYRRDGRVFFSATDLLKDRYQREELWVAAPAVEFGYLLVKKVLKGGIALHQKQRLHVLAQSLEGEAHAIAWRCFGARLGAEVMRWILAEDWAALEHKLPRLRSAVLWHTLWRDPLNFWRYWGPEILRIWRRWRYPTGLSVAVLGPDGAGKSALITRLRTDLEEAFRRSTVYHLQPDILRRHQDLGPVTTPHAKAPHPLGLSLLKLLYYWFDYSAGYLLQIRQHLVRSTLVLFDRYYDDLLVDARRYRYRGPSWLARWVQHLIPRPNLFFILDAPAAQCRQRKQELSEAEIQRQRGDYRRLSAALPQGYVLDAAVSEAEVARQARAIILDVLHARYLQRRHLWFAQPKPSITAYQRALAPFIRLHETADGSFPASQERTALFGLLALGDGRGYLVPMRSRRAAVAAMRLYNPQTRTARLGRQLLQVGLRLGLGQAFLRRVWLPLSSRSGPQRTPHVAVLGYLQEFMGQEHLTFGISLGTPGPHQKPVVQIMEAQGHTIGYAKVGHDAASDALVQHEAQMLRTLAKTSWEHVTLPQVLTTAWFQDHFLCVLSPLPAASRRLAAHLTPLHLAALQEFWTRHTTRMPLTASPLWDTLLKQAHDVKHAYYHRVLARGITTLEHWCASTMLPFGLSHGDFTPWNLQQDGPRLGMVDWECATETGPPLWDLLHFVFQTAYLVKHWDAPRIAAAMTERSAPHGPLTQAARSLGLAASALTPLALLYSVERLAFWARSAPEHPELLRTFSALVHLLSLEP